LVKAPFGIQLASGGKLNAYNPPMAKYLSSR